MNHKIKAWMTVAALAVAGCSSFKSKRMDDKGIDDEASRVTDQWVNGDTIIVLDQTIQKMQEHPRLKKYLQKRAGKDIKLFVGEIQNNTSESYFPIRDLEDAFLDRLSTTEPFVLIDAAQRERLLKEITYQNDGMVDPAQAKTIGKQSGADLMIFGAINMRPYERDGKTVKTYSVNLRLTDIESGEEICRTRAEINKFSKGGKSGW